MINLDDYALFRDTKASLKELSKDDSKPDICYMTESEIKAVDFDRVKRLYTNSLGRSEETASSVDGISHTQDTIVFIEFKNGNVETAKVKTKVRDSLLIFCDITGTTVAFTRDTAEFILVYNEDRHPPSPEDIQPSPSRDLIVKGIARLAKQENIRFTLDIFKNLYFKDVHTYTKKEFDEYVSKLKC